MIDRIVFVLGNVFVLALLWWTLHPSTPPRVVWLAPGPVGTCLTEQHGHYQWLPCEPEKGNPHGQHELLPL
jgi:hypothetical protein